MRKIFKNNFGNFLTVLLVFLMISGWLFSGWPRVWDNPRIPSEIQEALAATQTKIALTAASVKDGGGYADCDDNGWAIEGLSVQADLQTEDGSEVNVTPANFDDGDMTYTLELSNFGFDLPADSAIDGIEVTIKRRSLGGADGKDYHLQLTKSAGTPVASSDDNADTTTIWPASITAATYGGADSDWNTTWTEAEVENSGFGLVFAAMAVGANADIWVDQIQITVHYTPPNITVGTGGTQTTNMDVNSSENYVGGYFTFVRDAGSANVTEIIISETGTVNANSDLSNLKIYYETAETCVYNTGEDLFGTALSFDASENATITGTMAVGTSQVCVYIVLDVGSGASADETVLIEISASSDVTVSAGTVSAATWPVAIADTTTLQAGASLTFIVTTDDFPNLDPGTPVFATSTLSVDTGNSTGWHVTLLGNNKSDTTNVLNDGKGHEIPDPPNEWSVDSETATSTGGNADTITSGDDYFYFRVMVASGSPKFWAGWWGTDDIISSGAKWAGIASSSDVSRIGESSVSSGGSPALNTVQYYVDVLPSQESGNYSGTITFTATMNP